MCSGGRGGVALSQPGTSSLAADECRPVRLPERQTAKGRKWSFGFAAVSELNRTG